MVMAASGGNADEEIMKYAANLTIDNEEYAQFNKESPKVNATKLQVHASTQTQAVEANFDKASNSNSFEMLQMFARGVATAAPGQ